MVFESKELLTELREIAGREGFQLFGAAPAIVPESDKEKIRLWVEEGRHGSMEWYPRNMPLRLELEGLGFKPETVLVFGALYSDTEYENLRLPFRFSRYAMGEDYHSVLRKRGAAVIDRLKALFPGNRFRQGVDSLPVPEKVLAREAGIGWVGKNTNLLNEEFGSFFFLTVLFTDLPLQIANLPAKDRCGTCTACIDACPTDALEPYRIDSRKCISYKTIEDRSEEVAGLHGWAYGCDICQEVCPWNRIKAKKNDRKTEILEFKIRDIFKEEGKLENLNESEFRERFRDSAVSRISYSQFRRNLDTVKREK
ncbi:tRNA epoxyqueuosine(34) reductase QueG [Leptospira wolffii]|uniref:tRNA epoxyqueuosine(34) reductase QueG n=1 Tax=Leptospira wolffii TaxID=409998 RepID=UPI0003125825|nr:tRNA epoxyqueuosine(34) reductase QueG [Leptospira wolffii]EPG67444.1 epoxyqueuosine reductase [Leptospira wolffii serovar Khorat str. Khorat-H2]